MKNFVKFFGIIAIVAIIGFTMVACGGGGGGKLSGTYVGDGTGIILTFSGKKINMKTGGYDMDGTFSTKGDEITVSWDGTGKSQTEKFTLEGDKFTWISQGISATYTKQK
jgi:hypothetical protein